MTPVAPPAPRLGASGPTASADEGPADGPDQWRTCSPGAQCPGPRWARWAPARWAPASHGRRRWGHPSARMALPVARPTRWHCGHLSSRSPSSAAAQPAWGSISSDDIVDVALRVVERDDLDRLTIRGLSADLGVAPMSLYCHVRDNDDLLDEVASGCSPTRGSPSCPRTTGAPGRPRPPSVCGRSSSGSRRCCTPTCATRWSPRRRWTGWPGCWECWSVPASTGLRPSGRTRPSRPTRSGSRCPGDLTGRVGPLGDRRRPGGPAAGRRHDAAPVRRGPRLPARRHRGVRASGPLGVGSWSVGHRPCTARAKGGPPGEVRERPNRTHC